MFHLQPLFVFIFDEKYGTQQLKPL